jgi:F-type H+-transporting ATPase subunit a
MEMVILKMLLGAQTTLPELPNFITFIHRHFEGAPWASWLYQWESVIFSLLIAVSLALLFHFGIRQRALFPKGLQNFLELLAELLRKFVTEVLGPEGEKFIPFLGTLFIYILTMNLIGLVPLMKSPSSNLNITAALAICVFCLVQYLNIRNFGFLGFLYHLAGSPKGVAGWLLAPLMFPVEVITQLARPMTLALRLFGNILGGDIFVGIFAVFGIGLVAQLHSPVGLPLQLPFMFLGLLAGVLQAMVFTLLTTVYILLSMPHEEEHH